MKFLKSIYHFLFAWAGSIVYGHPSRKLVVIGITGTKGKSSVIELLHAILSGAGKKTAMISTVHIKIGEQEEDKKGGSFRPSAGTMPGRFALQRFLNQAVQAGCQYAIVEVTSQGVAQHRHRFIDFDASALTNLQPEHIDSHGSFEAYRDAKVRFFADTARRSKKGGKLFFLPEGDLSAKYFEAVVGEKGRIIRFSQEGFVEHELQGNAQVVSPWLRSNFNLANAALAVSIAKAYGATWSSVVKVLAGFAGVPGRVEWVTPPGKPAVVIDYAHTPDSLDALYSFLKPQAKKLICVFGSAGGGRDVWKRPKMGEVASKYCDRIILTSEDPYDENPAEIAGQIGKGTAGVNVEIVLDRSEAIARAIAVAETGDIIALTGMGSQAKFYGPKGVATPWNEKEIVEVLIRKKVS